MAYNGSADLEGDVTMEDYADPYNKAKYESDSSAAARDFPLRPNHHQTRPSQSSLGPHDDPARRYSPYSPMKGMSPASQFSPYSAGGPTGPSSPNARQTLHSSHSQQPFTPSMSTLFAYVLQRQVI